MNENHVYDMIIVAACPKTLFLGINLAPFLHL